MQFCHRELDESEELTLCTTKRRVLWVEGYIPSPTSTSKTWKKNQKFTEKPKASLMVLRLCLITSANCKNCIIICYIKSFGEPPFFSWPKISPTKFLGSAIMFFGLKYGRNLSSYTEFSCRHPNFSNIRVLPFKCIELYGRHRLGPNPSLFWPRKTLRSVHSYLLCCLVFLCDASHDILRVACGFSMRHFEKKEKI